MYVNVSCNHDFRKKIHSKKNDLNISLFVGRTVKKFQIYNKKENVLLKAYFRF